MPRYRQRKQATKRKNLLGLLLIVTVSCIFLFLAFFRYELINNQTLYDPKTLCPIDKASPKYIALVFDKSDSYNKVQQHFLRRYFSEFKNRLLPGTQVSLYVIDKMKDKHISPDFVVCAPRTGDGANAKHLIGMDRQHFLPDHSLLGVGFCCAPAVKQVHQTDRVR